MTERVRPASPFVHGHASPSWKLTENIKIRILYLRVEIHSLALWSENLQSRSVGVP